ncbi:MAG: ATP synthase F1 subunit epsilon [Clostridium sp.]
MATFEMEIVTPEKKFFKGQIESINFTTLDGKAQILANHIPYVTGLKPAVVKIVENGHDKYLSMSGGFIQFADNKGTILADSAEWPQEIDLNRAKDSLERAENRIKAKEENVDIARAKLALLRATARIKASEFNK